MFQKILCTLSFVSFITTISLGQEVWSLQKCVQYAQQNSLQVKQAENSIRQSQLSEEENKNQQLPDVNANFQGGLDFGRTIDPVTNNFTLDSRLSNSVSIQANYIVYNGNRIKNSIKQSEINTDIAKGDADQIRNTLALSVAQAYLQILFDDEALANANKRIDQTQDQLKQTDKLIKAGTLPQADRLDILAQIARDEQAIVNQENSLEISYLNLKQLLQLNPDLKMKVEKPSDLQPDGNPEAYTLPSIYQKALSTQPIITNDKKRLESVAIDKDIANSLQLPTVRLFGNVNSFYSNQVKTANGGRPGFTDPEDVIINNANATIEFPTIKDLEFKNVGYFTQINDNFGQSLGVNVSIPIYNQNRTGIAKERAQLNLLNTRITADQNKQQLKVDIQRAIADAKAAKKEFEANSKTVEALDAAYKNTEKRYKLGAVNTFEYTTAKNRLDQAAVDLIIAKYRYLYTVKVVEFYEGKKLTLE